MKPQRIAVATMLLVVFVAAATVELAREDLDGQSIAVLSGVAVALGIVWTLTKGSGNG